MERIAKTVWIAPLAPGVWLHTTTYLIEGGYYFPANGLVVERDSGSLMIDTGYTPNQAEALFAWSKERLAAPINEAVATHFHNDRTGGIPALKAHGVPTLTHPLTYELAKLTGQPTPEPIHGFGSEPYQLSSDCELFFPGGGHTRDNIVAWLPGPRVLMGGCFLKSTTSKGLGNVADAVLDEWAVSVERTRERYRQAEVIIPGHGTIEGDAIAKTLALLAATRPVAPAASDSRPSGG